MDIQIFKSVEDIKKERFVIDTSRRVLECLNACYPGYDWRVQINTGDMVKQGFLSITNFSISDTLCYNVFLCNIVNDPDLKKIKEGAGYLLEACGLSRERMVENQVLDNGDFAGRVLFDPNAMKGGIIEAPKYIRDWWNDKKKV